jgi:long-subunit acyl-CoA synthetase (AMP-forming)
MLANTSMITENKEAKTVDCSGEIKFRNGQVFKIYFKLQKDTNGKLDAHVEWL